MEGREGRVGSVWVTVHQASGKGFPVILLMRKNALTVIFHAWFPKTGTESCQKNSKVFCVP